MVKLVAEKHIVESETSDRKYVVVKYEDGSWACSCPKWIFQRFERVDCKHIRGLLYLKEIKCQN